MFFNREKERKALVSILEREPSLVRFIYGPINSGKTNLINTVLRGLPKSMIPFYINMRGRDVWKHFSYHQDARRTAFYREHAS